MTQFPNKSLDFELWPQPDRSAWEAAINRPSLLGNGSQLAYMSEASRKRTYQSYAYWLNYLYLSEKSALSEGVSDRVSVGRVVQFSNFLGDRVTDRTRASYFQNFYTACRSFDPKRDWNWLREFTNILHAEAGPPIDKPVHSSSKLFWLGINLMENASIRSLLECVRYRDGLIIALLAVRPIRRRNLAALKIGEHFIETKNGYRLRLLAEETKNRKHVEMDIPSFLDEYFDFYFGRVRKRFPDHALYDAVWLSMYGGVLTESVFYHRLRKHTGEQLGHPVGPHAFRVSAATTIAREAPTEVASIPKVLGNRGFDIAEKYYNLATTYDASRTFNETMNGFYDELD